MINSNTFEGLIPLPSSITKTEGFFGVDVEKKLSIVTDTFFASELNLMCSQLTLSGLSCEPSQSKDGKTAISVTHDTNCTNAEGYTLAITPTAIEIRASDAAGAFYAVQTLRQIAMVCTTALPCVVIQDAPLCEWRGLMIDTSRSFYPVEFLKKMIDIAAFHKLNRFHWHFTDDQGWRLPVAEYPLLTEIGGYQASGKKPSKPKIGGFYTEEEITQLVDFAAERHVIVVPEIDSPGHCSAVLAAYPNLGCTGGPYQVEHRYGIFKEVLCAGNDDVFVMLEKIFDTVCRLFPGEYVHIGGDECPRTRWKSCPKCRDRIQKEGLANADQIQGWFTAKITDMLETRGKIAIGWDEVLNGTEKTGLSENLIVQSWQGVKGGQKAVQRGHRVIMSPQTEGCYLNFKHRLSFAEPGRLFVASVKKSYSFNPKFDLSCKNLYIGGQANFWSEAVPAPKSVEYLLFPRLCAIAECLWLPADKKDFDSFAERLNIHKERLDALDVSYYRGALK